MRKGTYTFDVPNHGTVKIKAPDAASAMAEILDMAGIKMIGAVEKPREQPTKPQLRLVKSDVSQS